MSELRSTNDQRDDAGGSAQTQLTSNTASDAPPTWSSDGMKIAFQSNRDGNVEIYAMNADGSGQTRLTNNVAQDEFPAWSPDGAEIAFASTRDGDFDVFKMNSDGSAQTNLTNSAGTDELADWSPDGTKIAFASSRDGNFEIYTMNAVGGDQTRLTNDGAPDFSPAWSPGGGQIAFSRNPGGGSDIYVMLADGSGESPYPGPGEDISPDWQPLPVPALDITNVGQYKLPKTCFEVRTPSQAPLFDVCDNDCQGLPDLDPVCLPDGVCDDDASGLGRITVPVVAGDYRVVVSSAAPNHTPPAEMQCDAAYTACVVTAVSAPMTDPWFPWDVTGDGSVASTDFFALLGHFNQTKP